MVPIRFGRLTVIAVYDHKLRNTSDVLCACECGTRKTIKWRYLKEGDSKSCGCLRRDICYTKMLTHGHNKRGQRSNEYNVWAAMLSRCNNPRCKSYPNYGGRGISVCEDWHSFDIFSRDIGEIQAGLTIERIDNDGNYEPSNVRLANRTEQANNKRNNRLIEHDGEIKSLSHWSESTGLKRETIADRLNNGWSVKRALETPIRSKCW